LPSAVPKVSVGLPTYNRAASLHRAIESVLEQTHRDLELVISDNASTDGTEALCRGWAERDERVRYVRAAVNGGAVVNFNRVIGELRGTYAMVMGDDDWLDPDYVERCLAELERNPDHALVGGRPRYYVDGRPSHDGEDMNLLDHDAGRRLRSYLATVRENGIFYGLARGDALRAAMPLHDLLGADWLVVGAIAFAGKVRTLPETHINRTYGSTSSSVRRVLATIRRRPGHARIPWVYTAATVFADMAWRLPAYAPAGRFGRVRYAIRHAPLFLRWKSSAWLIVAPPFIALRRRPRGRWIWRAFTRAVGRIGGVPHWELDS
jgi:glycosyltransferase involved in cell wall biosynthesis